ncbi:MAG TPA: DUF87 domain-containing protein [Candidatus Nanoarchaeia archaeon]|nr:DUF87 domain-containing protein [Candidatus Nanoarchaeia archaeon]
MRVAANHKFADFVILTLIIALALFGTILAKKYIGFVGSEVPADAGYITSILIDDRQPTAYWHGLFGLVFSQSGFNESQGVNLDSGEITTNTFVFDCMDPSISENEMYASRNSVVDFSNVVAGNTDMIDRDMLNLSLTIIERANNTFTNRVNITLGSTVIQNVPAAYTYINDAPNTTKFYTAILNASNTLLLAIKVYGSSTTSFKGTIVDYQALLPIFNDTTKWYFFPDPNDECPAGLGIGQVGDAVLSGFVFETNSTNPIADATVSAGGNITLTDENGFYNITVPGNKIYDLISFKDGYITNITRVNTTIGQTTYQNLTMAIFYGYQGPNSTVSGYVLDNSTGFVLPNVTVRVGGISALTNGTGNYSFGIPQGTYTIAGIKSGYDNFVGNISVSFGRNLTFIFNMSPAVEAIESQNGTILNNGTIEGFVRDSLSSALLSGVSVTVAGVTNITTSLGFYNITSLEGTTNLVAVKSGYNNYFSEVNISANNITFFNFSMSLVSNASGGSNGSVNGTVRSSSGGLLEGVVVSVAGVSNSSGTPGNYLLNGIPQGTHNLVATKSGFENYIAVINVSGGITTTHDITMTTVTEAGLGAGSGAGSGSGSGAGKGAGQGPGRGAGTGIQAQVQQPIRLTDYEISVRQILNKLRVGNYIQVPITISNFREEAVNLKFSIEGDAKKLARLDKERMIIESGQGGDVMLTMLGNVEPGIYEGFFVVSGDINEKIPIYVLVLDRERLDVESLVIRITPSKKKYSIGEFLKYRVDLQNLLSEDKYKVKLSYYLDSITSNRSILMGTEDIVIQTSFAVLKSYKIPSDVKNGDYALKVKAEFLDRNAEESTILLIGLPFYKYAVFGLIPIWLIALLMGVLSSGTAGFMIYKKKQSKKKRYQIEIDQSTMPKPGPRTAYVGKLAESSSRVYFDLDLFQVHTIVSGSSGSGKSIVAQDLVEESLMKGVAAIVFDPTAQWTGFLRKLEDKRLLSAYKGFGMKKTDARAFNGNVHQIENARELVEFHKFMKPGEINVFVTNKLSTKDIELFVANTIRQVFRANLPESRELKYLIIYDGIHSLLPKFGGTGQVFTQIERATREFRKWGVGLILLSQVVSDFPPEVLANINTEISLRTRDEGDLNRIKEKFGENVLQSVVKASVGTAVVQNAAYNKGKPFFVAFRPPLHSTGRISDEELENYNKFNNIIDDLEYQLEQLERLGVDIFDLKLELKLSADKVKSGNFNMVNIYLDGLRPRIQGNWDKLGKEPAKREIKFISESELEEELEKAKKGRKKEQDKEDKRKEGEEKERVESEKLSNESAAKDEKGKNEEKPAQEEKTRKNDDEISPLDKIGKIENDISKLMESGEKPKAVELYKKEQDVYKNASKDEKPELLKKCTEIQKILSAK